MNDNERRDEHKPLRLFPESLEATRRMLALFDITVERAGGDQLVFWRMIDGLREVVAGFWHDEVKAPKERI